MDDLMKPLTDDEFYNLAGKYPYDPSIELRLFAGNAFAAGQSSAQKEITSLNQIISDCSKVLGIYIEPEDSLDYKKLFPAEIEQLHSELTAARARIAELETTQKWQLIETAPKDGTPILGWNNHESDPYSFDEGKTLTIYGAHCEGLSHAVDGYGIFVWGGEYEESDYPGVYMPSWWFVNDGYFEIVANPTHWMPLPHKPLE